MEKKSQDFSMKDAQRLAGTTEGQKLMQLLQQQDAGQLQKVMDAAGCGNSSVPFCLPPKPGS